jgi:hypothetical protein
MIKLIDLRYASKEHLVNDLQALQLKPKQYTSTMLCLRQHIGSRIIIKRRKQAGTLYIDIINDGLTLHTQVSANGVQIPIQYE